MITFFRREALRLNFVTLNKVYILQCLTSINYALLIKTYLGRYEERSLLFGEGLLGKLLNLPILR